MSTGVMTEESKAPSKLSSSSGCKQDLNVRLFPSPNRYEVETSSLCSESIWEYGGVCVVNCIIVSFFGVSS